MTINPEDYKNDISLKGEFIRLTLSCDASEEDRVFDGVTADCAGIHERLEHDFVLGQGIIRVPSRGGRFPGNGIGDVLPFLVDGRMAILNGQDDAVIGKGFREIRELLIEGIVRGSQHAFAVIHLQTGHEVRDVREDNGSEGEAHREEIPPESVVFARGFDAGVVVDEGHEGRLEFVLRLGGHLLFGFFRLLLHRCGLNGFLFLFLVGHFGSLFA